MGNDITDYFPHKSFRPYQKETLLEIKQAFESEKKRFVIMAAPTGSGKSSYAMTFARYNKEVLKGKSYIVTSQKILQDQYEKEFNDLAVVKGRDNFKCPRCGDNCSTATKLTANTVSHLSSDLSDSVKKKIAIKGHTYKVSDICKIMKDCEYIHQRDRGRQAPNTLLNYASFLHYMNYTNLFSQRELTIFDEGHLIENHVMHFVSVRLTKKQMQEFGYNKIPDYDKLDDYAIVLMTIINELDHKIKVLEKENTFLNEQNKGNLETKHVADKIDENTEKISEYVDTVNKLKSISEQINYFEQLILHGEADRWLFDFEGDLSDPSALVFKPLTVKIKAHEKMFQFTDKVLIMSATIGDFDIFCNYLGIRKEDAHFINLPSTFPIENRPIKTTSSYIGWFNKGNLKENLPKIIDKSLEIIKNHPGEKGVIHTTSYMIQKAFQDKLQRNSNFLFPDSKNKEIVLKEFMSSKQPLVIVSPSLTHGVDLKDDYCRFQIICKVPYPSLGDKQVKERMALDSKWYSNQTGLVLVQTYGRGVRNEKDWCITYVLDEAFSGFLSKAYKLLPDWFLDAIE